MVTEAVAQRAGTVDVDAGTAGPRPSGDQLRLQCQERRRVVGGPGQRTEHPHERRGRTGPGVGHGRSPTVGARQARPALGRCLVRLAGDQPRPPALGVVGRRSPRLGDLRVGTRHEDREVSGAPGRLGAENRGEDPVRVGTHGRGGRRLDGAGRRGVGEDRPLRSEVDQSGPLGAIENVEREAELREGRLELVRPERFEAGDEEGEEGRVGQRGQAGSVETSEPRAEGKRVGELRLGSQLRLGEAGGDLGQCERQTLGGGDDGLHGRDRGGGVVPTDHRPSRAVVEGPDVDRRAPRCPHVRSMRAARGQHHRHPVGVEPAGREVENLPRRRVEPLHVVDHHEDGARLGHVGQQAMDPAGDGERIAR